MYHSNHSKEHFEESKKTKTEKLVSGYLMIVIGVILFLLSVSRFTSFKKDWGWVILAVVSLVVASLGGVLLAGKL